MILQVEKRNDAIVQPIKQKDPRLYEALRKSDRIEVPLQEVHGFGVSGDVFVQDNAFPPLVIQHSLRLRLLCLGFIDPPTGTDFIADVRKRQSGCSILKAPVVFPDGFTELIERSEFGIATFERGDVLICDMLQVGSANPGTLMSMYLYFDAVT